MRPSGPSVKLVLRWGHLAGRSSEIATTTSLAVIGAVLLATTVASAIKPTATRPLAQRNPARKRRMRVKVPKPPRTFLEMDELVSLIDAAGARDAPIARQAFRHAQDGLDGSHGCGTGGKPTCRPTSSHRDDAPFCAFTSKKVIVVGVERCSDHAN